MYKNNLRNLILLSLLAYLLAVSVRLYGLGSACIQADEIHWQARSREVVGLLKTGQYARATTHLGHPGISPALVMASGQVLASLHNRFHALNPSDHRYLDRLSASRLANAVVSSLVVPLLIIGSFSLIGLGPAFLAASLFAFDPLHIALSRQAHVDTVLTLLVLATVFLYAYSVRKGSVCLKSIAGVLWGLSIATKPTAAALVFVFFFFKIIRSSLLGCRGKCGDSGKASGETSWLSWSDVWAVLLGHFVFACIYTRLWVHESDYLIRLKIESEFADQVYRLGSLLADYSMLPGLLLIGVLLPILIASLKVCRAEVSSHRCFHLTMFALLIAVLTLMLSFVPQVFENIVRFWTWVAGLSAEEHKAYGFTWKPPPYGYLSLYLSRIPVLVLLGLPLFFCFFIPSRNHRFSTRSKEVLSFYALLTLSVVLWTLLLSVSDKQTLRYAMPVVPFLYLLSAVGLYRCFVVLWLAFSRFSFFFRRLSPRRAAGVFILCALAVQSAYSASWYPDYNLFMNLLSGGLSAAVERQQALPLAGVHEAIKFLRTQEPFTERGPVFVMVAGDLQIVTFSYKRLFPGEEKIKFTAPRSASSGGYLLVIPQFRDRLLSRGLKKMTEAQPVFSYSRRGAELLAVYKVPVLDYHPGVFVEVTGGAHVSGKLKELAAEMYQPMLNTARGENLTALIAQPAVDSNGYLVSGEFPSFLPGTYRARFWLSLVPGVRVREEYGPERYVVRLDFGRCERIVVLGDLSDRQMTPVDLSCSFDRNVRAQLRTYWFGNVPVAVAGIELEREME